MLLPALALLTLAPTDLVFVRHGETVANATGRYNARTLNVLSAKGVDQVQRLTAELLREPRFDRIYVSPSPRALLTIAPYLRATRRRAVVWPLLYECCTGRRDASSPTRLDWGGKVSLPGDLASLFEVRPRWNRLPNSPDWGRGLAQTEASVRVFRQELSGGRVLLVGHSGHGGQFLHALTGRWTRVENARPIRLELP